MMCEACERGDHANCGMQTWCECDCDPDNCWSWMDEPDYEAIAAQNACQHEYEWKTQPSSPSGLEEHFKVCKHCGMEEPGSYP